MNDPTDRRHSWRTPRKSQQDVEFGSAGSVRGIAGSSTIGTSFRSPNEKKSPSSRTATAIATPITQASEVYSPASFVSSPRPAYRLHEEEDGHSLQWSLEPGDFISRPAAETTVSAVPVTPTHSFLSTKNVSPARHPGSRRDLSLYQEDDSILMSEDPEMAYFQYMLRLEQEQRAQKGKPAEDSLLGDSDIEELLRAGPMTAIPLDEKQSLNPPSTFGGFSLATTEKSNQQARSVSIKSMHLSTISSKSPWKIKTTSQVQQRGVPLHEQGEQNFGKVLPDVIYVLEKNSSTTLTKVCGEKAQACNNSIKEEPHRILFFAVTFVLCAVMFAGAAVAIYFSNFYDHGSSSSNAQLALNETAPTGTTPATPYPSITPFRPPSEAPPQRKTHAPTKSRTTSTMEPTYEETYGGTNPPTWEPTSEETYGGTNPPTWKPTDSPTYNPTKEASSEPSNLPTSHPSLPPSLPTQSNTLEPNHNVSSTPAFTNVSECGCRDCVNLLGAFADGVPCRDRIYYLAVRWGIDSALACHVVVGEEFPTECSSSLCDPLQCVLLDDNVNAISPTTPQPTTKAPTTQSPTPEPTTPRPTLRPTLSPVPSIAPTQRPTSLKLNLEGNDGDPTQAFPLARCEGDCDTDQDCSEGLICYQRGKYDRVPGCLQGHRENSQTDFCVPEWATLSPTDPPTVAPTPAPIPTRPPTPHPTFGGWATWYPTFNPTYSPTFSPTVSNFPTFSDGRTTTTQSDTLTEEEEKEENIFAEIACDIFGAFCS